MIQSSALEQTLKPDDKELGGASVTVKILSTNAEIILIQSCQ